MTVIDLTTDIEAPVARVFDLARDLDLHARSMAHTGERAVGGRTAGRIELGEAVTWRARHFGLWWSLTSRITALDPPTSFEDAQERGPFAWFRHEHRFEAVGGSTRMHDRWEHRSPLGPIGRLADHLVLGRYMRSQLVIRNEALKRAAEGVVSASPADRRLLVLFDADCGICSQSARVLRRLDRGRRLRIVPLQSAAEIPDAPPMEALLEAIHVRDRHGRWTAGGDAWISIARALPLLRPIGVAARVPAVRRLIEWTYARVAGNRHRIGRLLGAEACAIPPRTR